MMMIVVLLALIKTKLRRRRRRPQRRRHNGRREDNDEDDDDEEEEDDDHEDVHEDAEGDGDGDSKTASHKGQPACFTSGHLAASGAWCLGCLQLQKPKQAALEGGPSPKTPQSSPELHRFLRSGRLCYGATPQLCFRSAVFWNPCGSKFSSGIDSDSGSACSDLGWLPIPSYNQIRILQSVNAPDAFLMYSMYP